MRCACATASSWRGSPSAPGCRSRRSSRPLEEAERRGLVERDLHRVRPTERGFDFLNDLLALFLPGAIALTGSDRQRYFSRPDRGSRC